MTLIDGDRIITAQLYDDEYEEFIEKKMSIIDFVNIYTTEGVTIADDVLDKIRAEIEEYKLRQLTLAIGVDDLEKGKQIALEYVLAILNKYRAEGEVSEHFADIGKTSVINKTQDCDTCKHHDKSWDELPCDGCCTAHSGYESQAVDERVDEKVDRAFDKLLEPFKKGETE